jgi:hypothetical protein
MYKALCSIVKLSFFLDTKLTDSKNYYDNFEVFCFCFCGYEVVYYYLFENEVFVFEIRAEIVFISGCNNEPSAKESLQQSFLLILLFPDLNKIMKFSCFDVYFEVIPKIDKRPFYFIITDESLKR